MVAAKEILINYLQELQEQGQTHVSIEPEAREILMQWYKAGKKTNKTALKQQKNITQLELEKPLFEEKSKPAKVAKPENEFEQVSNIKAKSINYLFSLQAEQPNLKWVDSIYRNDASLVIITEKPQTAQQNQKLTQILTAMGLDLEQMSIASLYKQPQAMINEEYTRLSVGLLAQELKAYSHSLILGLGESLEKQLHKLSAEHHIATPFKCTSIDLEALIAADQDLGVKRQFWVSMLEVMNALKLPISKKQEGYFIK